MSGPEATYEVVLEVERAGRRPRYHRGAKLENGTVLKPEQCNLDQAAGAINELDGLPPVIRRPLTQLCHRCWAGHPLLEGVA